MCDLYKAFVEGWEGNLYKGMASSWVTGVDKKELCSSGKGISISKFPTAVQPAARARPFNIDRGPRRFVNASRAE